MRICASGHLVRMPMLQQLGRILVVALTDQDGMCSIVFVFVHLLQNPGQYAGFTAGLEEKVNLAVVGTGGPARACSGGRNETDHPNDTPVFGQVVKAGQSKQDVGGIGKLLQGKTDILKVKPFADQLVGQLGGIAQSTGGNSACPK